MTRSLPSRFALTLTILLFVTGIALGQGTTSRVTGTVVDPSGAVVPAATVTLTNDATQISFNTETTESGTYVFDSVQVGDYTVTVEKQGFKKFISTANTVNINQPATVNVTMEIGGVTEEVRVESSAEIVQTSSSGNFGNTVEQRTLQALPIVGARGRNPLNFILFQPGVTPDSNAGGGVHVHGARDRAFNFTLDGIDINDTTAGGSNFTPIRTNPDSLTEFQVVTGNFTAELGRSSGAQVTLVTRSGTNEFHGTAFEFYQTPRFHANEYENTINRINRGGQLITPSTPKFVQHIFGGSVGGPIIKNKAFFFTNLQLLRTSQSILATRTVYTADARAGRFRFVGGGRNAAIGGTLAPSVDANGNPLPGLNIQTFNITGNPNIPLGLDPTTQRLIALAPLPNNFSVGDGLNTAGFSFSAPSTERQYDFTTKIDYNFNERNALYVRYAQGAQNTIGDNGNGGLQRFPDTPNFVDTFRTPRNLAVNLRSTLSPKMVNEFVVGFNRYTFSFNNPDPNANANSPVILNLPTDPLNSTPNINNARSIRTYQLVDNLS
ncbi:MAG: carboxypeptidase regulatory-like domain-containing protein, partial [Acidobacteria bacterium]|nr:carboxypeptidase regulatory-like domain-containing protein [Acidobacteriota bacterium]